MPIAFTVVPRQRAVYITCDERIAINDIRVAADAIRDHPAFQPDFPLVIDLTAVSELAIDFAAVSDFVHSGHDPSAPGTRRAIIVASDEAFGMARMFSTLADQLHVAIFRSREAALAWLGCDLPA